jgi:hypothetical protein
MTGFVLGVFSPLLVWMVSLFPLVSGFLGRDIGVNTDLGVKLNTILFGQGTFQLPEILIAGVTGGILVMLGTWIYQQKWSPEKLPFLGPKMERATLILFYASITATIVLALPMFEIPPLTTIIVMAVNSVITAWFLTNVLGDQLNLVK